MAEASSMMDNITMRELRGTVSRLEQLIRQLDRAQNQQASQIAQLVFGSKLGPWFHQVMVVDNTVDIYNINEIIHSFSTLPDGADFSELSKVMSPIGACEPEEIAAAFAYVASPEARYMTGAIVSIDGGITC